MPRGFVPSRVAGPLPSIEGERVSANRSRTIRDRVNALGLRMRPDFKSRRQTTSPISTTIAERTKNVSIVIMGIP